MIDSVLAEAVLLEAWGRWFVELPDDERKQVVMLIKSLQKAGYSARESCLTAFDFWDASTPQSAQAH
jgi:hypothetical protein